MPVPESRASVQRHLLRDTAYERLRAAIIDGTLAPGEPLHDEELCAWLGLSRTPVRDALNRLRDEKLIDMAPQRFTRVARMSATDVGEVIPLMAVLHSLATELAVPLMTRDHTRELRTANQDYVSGLRARNGEAAHAADGRFHDVFVRTCGNPEIDRALARLTPRLRRVECLCEGGLPGSRSVAQHEAMILRVEAGDAAGAATAARANWMTLGSVLERTFAAA